jgi:hypothetical protein
MVKKLFYASAAMLMLALAFHLGATTAQGQSGSMVTGFAVGSVGGNWADCYVITPNGDVFSRTLNAQGGAQPLVYIGNFWNGGPTPAAQPTWGQLKAQYRK